MRSLLFFTTLLLCCSAIFAYNNGVGKLPIMGWNSWNQFGCTIDEKLIIDTIDAMISKNLTTVGYQYVNIDDCWHLEQRDPATKQMIPDPKRFPRGIAYIADYAHARGLKLGIYSDVGIYTCQHRAGSFGYYEIDANTFASWGIDLLKLDTCHLAAGQAEQPWIYYTQMSKALNATGRPIVYSICNWGRKDPHTWAPQIAHSWRTTMDIKSIWIRVLEILDVNKKLAQYSGQYAYNDPDMLEVGVSTKLFHGLTERESRSHFTLWAAMNAPLVLGNDIRSLNTSSWVYEIITNKEIIALNQHELSKQAIVAKEIIVGHIEAGLCFLSSHGCKWIMVFTKQLSTPAGDMLAVIIFNRGSLLSEHQSGFSAEQPVLYWQDLGISGTFAVRDLWAHKDIGIARDTFTSPAPIEQHDVGVYLFRHVGK